MAEEYSYQKKRTDFGRHATFEDTETRIVGAVMANESQDTEYTPRNPNKIVLDNIPQMSEHRVSYKFLNLHSSIYFQIIYQQILTFLGQH